LPDDYDVLVGVTEARDPERGSVSERSAKVSGRGAWDNTDAGRHILVAVAHYLAARSPTERAALQTADIARRLMRGGELHQEAGASS
jgi:hypothetical protein